jgi:hypothetical protein
VKIVTHKPAARGVSQLMYVGDAPAGGTSPLVIAAAIVVGAWLLFGRS